VAGADRRGWGDRRALRGGAAQRDPDELVRLRHRDLTGVVRDDAARRRHPRGRVGGGAGRAHARRGGGAHARRVPAAPRLVEALEDSRHARGGRARRGRLRGRGHRFRVGRALLRGNARGVRLVGAERAARRSQPDRDADAVARGDRDFAAGGRVGGGALPRASPLAALALGGEPAAPDGVDGRGDRGGRAGLRFRARELSVVATVLARRRDLPRRVFLGRAVPVFRVDRHGRRALRLRPRAVRTLRGDGDGGRVSRVGGDHSPGPAGARAGGGVALGAAARAHARGG